MEHRQLDIGSICVWLSRDWTSGLAMTRSIKNTGLDECGESPMTEGLCITVGTVDIICSLGE